MGIEDFQLWTSTVTGLISQHRHFLLQVNAREWNILLEQTKLKDKISLFSKEDGFEMFWTELFSLCNRTNGLLLESWEQFYRFPCQLPYPPPQGPFTISLHTGNSLPPKLCSQFWAFLCRGLCFTGALIQHCLLSNTLHQILESPDIFWFRKQVLHKYFKPHKFIYNKYTDKT